MSLSDSTLGASRCRVDATRSMDHIIMCMRASFGRVALLPFRVSEHMQPGAERSRMRQFAVHFPARISCLAIRLCHTKELCRALYTVFIYA